MKKLLLLAMASVVGFAIVGCDKETDPQAKVDAPGYYNGPMKARGGGTAGAEGGAPATAGGATAAAPAASTGQ